MKKIITYTFMVLFSTLLSSCGIGYSFVANHNQNATEVHLSGNNFKVTDRVSGSSEVYYVFAIGGMSRKQMYENAYATMMKKANLLNSSKAIINLMTEEHFSGFAPFYVKRTITVSAQVVEFTR